MKYGYNISMRHGAQEIRKMAEELLKTDEFHAIEVTYSEHMRHIDTTEFNKALQEVVENYHPEVLVHISDFNLAEENATIQKAIVEEFRNCCIFTKSLNGKAIVVHCGSKSLMHISIYHEDGSRQTHEEVFEKLWKLSVETLKECCQIAAEYGLLVYTENLSNSKLIQTIDQLNQYINDIDESNLYIVFDVGHSFYTGNDVYTETLKCGKLLKHLHIHDNHGQKDEHLVVGEGDLPWEDFCKGLNENGYEGIYMLELYHSTVKGCMDSKKELLKYL